jgi:hypothetical protein
VGSSGDRSFGDNNLPVPGPTGQGAHRPFHLRSGPPATPRSTGYARWKLEGQGQRGGVRIIYYWVATDEQLRMLYAYAKSQQENLTPDQLAALRKIVERWNS